ncbi:hypothetical protein UFOVP1288_59 [uncultured Caudovirales phage]|uniref:Uncharacterized protein n=1 Tax=uncultured Caudovirales phage TaxID=2100421 RepID=A0A6J5RGF6_9CAUD|nr:hypothetical protein UFOVP1195_59 [uncultured Caudovirales phage]CAB4196089.1 hypothetical protein UFOVP1288_59 [uncultured Caudovirales phage]CAB4205137.1 hypothetical protein UFOVP1409_59 [uncultured Caudovirales phage]
MRACRGMGAVSSSKYAAGGSTSAPKKAEPAKKPAPKKPPPADDEGRSFGVPAEQLKPKNPPRVPDRMFQGEPDQGDEPLIKRAKGGANWIKGAIKKPGALRASLKVGAGDTISATKLNAAAKAPGKLGQRARFAKVLRSFRK